MSELLNALRRNLAGMEEIGDEETAKLLRKRIAVEEKALEEVEHLVDLNKAELLEKATAADIEGRASMSKAELLEALTEEA